MIRLTRCLIGHLSREALLAIVFLAVGSGVVATGSPVMQPERMNVKDHTYIVMADLSSTPSAPKSLPIPGYRIAQPQACLGQGSWCNETRQCCNGLCCGPDDRPHPGFIGMCGPRNPTSKCIPP